MDWYTEFDKLASDYLPDLEIAKEEPMRKHSSFRVGGPARRMAFPKSGEQIVLLIKLAEDCGTQPLIVGNGTNLLAPDAGLDRLVINTSTAFHQIQVHAGNVLEADSGVSLARLADTACREGLTGLEFAHGIPGTLGGAVCMNAGAYGGEMAHVLTSVTALFPKEGIKTLSLKELDLGYRHSIFSDCPEAVVLHATVQLHPGDSEEIRATMKDLLDRRKRSQPLEYPSAGSTFKRPAGHFAGALIEQCGLKGQRVGGAQVSEKHAGFLINAGGATCTDVVDLIHLVQKRVFDETGVTLEPEVKLVR